MQRRIMTEMILPIAFPSESGAAQLAKRGRYTCAVKRRWSTAGESPARELGSFHPEAIRAAVEETKPSEPLIFFDPNVTCDTALVEPLQHFPVAVGGIGCHPLWPPTISFAVAINPSACRRTLLTQAGGRRLYSNDHTAFIVDQIIIEVAQFGSAISLGQIGRIRIGGRHLVLLGSPSPFSCSSSSRYFRAP